MKFSEEEIDFEKGGDRIREENGSLLDAFSDSLRERGLKEKTINKHLGNVEFYTDDYLLYYDLNEAKDGIAMMDGFFNGFFLRKAMWSGVTATRETVASLKKFYKFLVDRGDIDAVDYRFLLDEVKQEMPGWISHYDDEPGYSG